MYRMYKMYFFNSKSQLYNYLLIKMVQHTVKTYAGTSLLDQRRTLKQVYRVIRAYDRLINL